jgi:hypothetical protein
MEYLFRQNDNMKSGFKETKYEGVDLSPLNTGTP